MRMSLTLMGALRGTCPGLFASMAQTLMDLFGASAPFALKQVRAREFSWAVTGTFSVFGVSCGAVLCGGAQTVSTIFAPPSNSCFYACAPYVTRPRPG